MSKKALNLSAIVLATTLTGCSSFMSDIGQFGSLNDGNHMPSDVKNQTTPEQRNQVSDAYGPIAIPADTVAMRLKEKFGFVSDGDVAAARNTGQGNAGWSASAVSEGTNWSSEPGNYYRMSRNWAGNDRLTIEVRRTFKDTGATGNKAGSFVVSTYISSDPKHVTDAWTKRLFSQIHAAARGEAE
ncbi:LptM family lipoprotein [Pantoea allii]|uniref:LptM family lipoprotein n=1 Tax=Pantoea allii TaxID=574096 RepID=UPI003D7AC208